MFNKIALSGVPNGFNNFSFGMLFSVIFHGSIFFATIFALPFVAKKPIELLPSISVELIQISEQMNIPYAPKAAKVIENTQRDINIALMNELSIIFNQMKCSTSTPTSNIKDFFIF